MSDAVDPLAVAWTVSQALDDLREHAPAFGIEALLTDALNEST